MLQLGGIFTPRRTFSPVALQLLRIIVTKAFVTFPEYMWAKNAEKKSDIFTSISNMAAENGHPTKYARKSYVKGLFGF